MSSPSSIALRRIPRQKRGQQRVAGLLAAAAEIFAECGYEAATMSAIARRADASIGSLYQFFPNKQALARGLRKQYLHDYQDLLAAFKPRAVGLDIEQFAARFIDLLIGFIDGHAAFLSLLDAPASTRSPGSRERVRRQIAGLLRAHNSNLGCGDAQRIAAVIIQINRGMMGLYADAPSADRGWIVEQFKAVLVGYLGKESPVASC